MARPSAAVSAAAPRDASTTIWLGLPGDLVGAEGDQVDHYCTRIGGAPVFPGSTVPSLPSPASATAAAAGSSTSAAAAAPKCSVCGASLSLVLQAYAPLPQLPDRALMLFGCTAKGCGRIADCWQALRCQLAAAPEPLQPSAATEAADGSAGATLTAAAGTGFDALDAGFGDWGDFTTPGAGGANDAAAPDTFDFSALTASLAATAKKQQEHQQQQQKLKQQQGGGKHKQQQQQAPELGDGQHTAAGSCKGVAGPPLPEYYVVSEVEPDAVKSKAISSRELQHVQQLLAAYEEAAASAEPLSAAPASGSHRQAQTAAAAAAAAAGAGGGEGEAGASWAGEEYEADSVSCMERAYVKFMKRLARAPQQCVRYCHGGRLLWPQKQAPAPSPCPRCGGARVFELQLMPPLLAMTLEAAGMAREQGLPVHAAVVNAAGNWDWCTIAVFSCAASCGSSSPAPDGSCDVAAEEVLLVREAECEVAAAAPPHQAGLSGGGGPDEGDEEE